MEGATLDSRESSARVVEVCSAYIKRETCGLPTYLSVRAQIWKPAAKLDLTLYAPIASSHLHSSDSIPSTPNKSIFSEAQI